MDLKMRLRNLVNNEFTFYPAKGKANEDSELGNRYDSEEEEAGSESEEEEQLELNQDNQNDENEKERKLVSGNDQKEELLEEVFENCSSIDKMNLTNPHSIRKSIYLSSSDKKFKNKIVFEEGDYIDEDFLQIVENLNFNLYEDGENEKGTFNSENKIEKNFEQINSVFESKMNLLEEKETMVFYVNIFNFLVNKISFFIGGFKNSQNFGKIKKKENNDQTKNFEEFYQNKKEENFDEIKKPENYYQTEKKEIFYQIKKEEIFNKTEKIQHFDHIKKNNENEILIFFSPFFSKLIKIFNHIIHKTKIHLTLENIKNNERIFLLLISISDNLLDIQINFNFSFKNSDLITDTIKLILNFSQQIKPLFSQEDQNLSSLPHIRSKLKNIFTNINFLFKNEVYFFSMEEKKDLFNLSFTFIKENNFVNIYIPLVDLLCNILKSQSGQDFIHKFIEFLLIYFIEFTNECNLKEEKFYILDRRLISTYKNYFGVYKSFNGDTISLFTFLFLQFFSVVYATDNQIENKFFYQIFETLINKIFETKKNNLLLLFYCVSFELLGLKYNNEFSVTLILLTNVFLACSNMITKSEVDLSAKKLFMNIYGMIIDDIISDFGKIKELHLCMENKEIKNGRDFNENKDGRNFYDNNSGRNFSEINAGRNFNEINTGRNFDEINAEKNFDENNYSDNNLDERMAKTENKLNELNLNRPLYNKCQCFSCSYVNSIILQPNNHFKCAICLNSTNLNLQVIRPEDDSMADVCGFCNMKSYFQDYDLFKTELNINLIETNDHLLNELSKNKSQIFEENEKKSENNENKKVSNIPGNKKISKNGENKRKSTNKENKRKSSNEENKKISKNSENETNSLNEETNSLNEETNSLPPQELCEKFLHFQNSLYKNSSTFVQTNILNFLIIFNKNESSCFSQNIDLSFKIFLKILISDNKINIPLYKDFLENVWDLYTSQKGRIFNTLPSLSIDQSTINYFYFYYFYINLLFAGHWRLIDLLIHSNGDNLHYLLKLKALKMLEKFLIFEGEEKIFLNFHPAMLGVLLSDSSFNIKEYSLEILFKLFKFKKISKSDLVNILFEKVNEPSFLIRKRIVKALINLLQEEQEEDKENFYLINFIFLNKLVDNSESLKIKNMIYDFYFNIFNKKTHQTNHSSKNKNKSNLNKMNLGFEIIKTFVYLLKEQDENSNRNNLIFEEIKNLFNNLISEKKMKQSCLIDIVDFVMNNFILFDDTESRENEDVDEEQESEIFYNSEKNAENEISNKNAKSEINAKNVKNKKSENNPKNEISGKNAGNKTSENNQKNEKSEKNARNEISLENQKLKNSDSNNSESNNKNSRIYLLQGLKLVKIISALDTECIVIYFESLLEFLNFDEHSPQVNNDITIYDNNLKSLVCEIFFNLLSQSESNIKRVSINRLENYLLKIMIYKPSYVMTSAIECYSQILSRGVVPYTKIIELTGKNYFFLKNHISEIKKSENNVNNNLDRKNKKINPQTENKENNNLINIPESILYKSIFLLSYLTYSSGNEELNKIFEFLENQKDNFSSLNDKNNISSTNDRNKISSTNDKNKIPPTNDRNKISSTNDRNKIPPTNEDNICEKIFHILKTMAIEHPKSSIKFRSFEALGYFWIRFPHKIYDSKEIILNILQHMTNDEDKLIVLRTFIIFFEKVITRISNSENNSNFEFDFGGIHLFFENFINKICSFLVQENNHIVRLQTINLIKLIVELGNINVHHVLPFVFASIFDWVDEIRFISTNILEKIIKISKEKFFTFMKDSLKQSFAFQTKIYVSSHLINSFVKKPKNEEYEIQNENIFELLSYKISKNLKEETFNKKIINKFVQIFSEIKNVENDLSPKYFLEKLEFYEFIANLIADFKFGKCNDILVIFQNLWKDHQTDFLVLQTKIKEYRDSNNLRIENKLLFNFCSVVMKTSIFKFLLAKYDNFDENEDLLKMNPDLFISQLSKGDIEISNKFNKNKKINNNHKSETPSISKEVKNIKFYQFYQSTIIVVKKLLKIGIKKNISETNKEEIISLMKSLKNFENMKTNEVRNSIAKFKKKKNDNNEFLYSLLFSGESKKLEDSNQKNLKSNSNGKNSEIEKRELSSGKNEKSNESGENNIKGGVQKLKQVKPRGNKRISLEVIEDQPKNEKTISKFNLEENKGRHENEENEESGKKEEREEITHRQETKENNRNKNQRNDKKLKENNYKRRKTGNK